MAEREDFFHCDFAGPLTDLFQIFYRPVDFLLSKVCLGNNASDGPTVPGNHDRFAAFDIVE